MGHSLSINIEVHTEFILDIEFILESTKISQGDNSKRWFAGDVGALKYSAEAILVKLDS